MLNKYNNLKNEKIEHEINEKTHGLLEFINKEFYLKENIINYKHDSIIVLDNYLLTIVYKVMSNKNQNNLFKYKIFGNKFNMFSETYICNGFETIKLQIYKLLFYQVYVYKIMYKYFT